MGLYCETEPELLLFFWAPTFFQTDQDLGSWFIYEDVFWKFEKLVMECSWNICVTVVPKVMEPDV